MRECIARSRFFPEVRNPKSTMAAYTRKVVAFGRPDAHPPRRHRVPALTGGRDRPLVSRVARAAASGRARGGGVHVVLPRDAGPADRPDPRAALPLLSPTLGAPDARRGGPRSDETVPALPDHGSRVRARRNGGDLAPLPPRAVRHHPYPLAVPTGGVRLGRPASAPRATRYNLLRGGAPPGPDRPAPLSPASPVGRPALRCGRGDLELHGDRAT